VVVSVPDDHDIHALDMVRHRESRTIETSRCDHEGRARGSWSVGSGIGMPRKGL